MTRDDATVATADPRRRAIDADRDEFLALLYKADREIDQFIEDHNICVATKAEKIPLGQHLDDLICLVCDQPLDAPPTDTFLTADLPADHLITFKFGIYYSGRSPRYACDECTANFLVILADHLSERSGGADAD